MFPIRDSACRVTPLRGISNTFIGLGELKYNCPAAEPVMGGKTAELAKLVPAGDSGHWLLPESHVCLSSASL